MKSNQDSRTLAILVGGGPAPGINGVIRSATIEAINNGLKVIGIYDGFEWLMKGDTSHVRELTIHDVSRIHFDGGSILRTSRANPTKRKEDLEACVNSLKKLSVDHLITIGGDDTATSARKVNEYLNNEITIAHVPKTIDNDLPLPQARSTFGYQTARHVGFTIVQALMEDAQTTRRWFFVVSMGRKAGHLALGIGKAAGATLIVIGEEFRNQKVQFSTICDILEGAVLKRLATGYPHGVAILAEGLADRIDLKELESYADLEKDAHGHVRYSEIDLGRIVKDEVRRRFKERNVLMTIVNKNIGYELRCANPIPFDCEYTQDLGYAAVIYLLAGESGAIITVDNGKLIRVNLEDITDPETGRVRTREVDIDSDSYRVARQYMIRLEQSDFDDPEVIQKMAAAGNLSVQEFEKRFRYLTQDPPVR